MSEMNLTRAITILVVIALAAMSYAMSVQNTALSELQTVQKEQSEILAQINKQKKFKKKGKRNTFCDEARYRHYIGMTSPTHSQIPLPPDCVNAPNTALEKWMSENINDWYK